MRTRILVVFAVLVGSVGCGSSTTPTSPSTSMPTATPAPTATPTPAAPTQASVAGVWRVTTVDGAALPVVLQVGDIRLELLSDMLTLAANGTFTESATTRFTNAGRVETETDVVEGTFTLDGNTINFVGNNGERRTGTLSGTTLTTSAEGHVFVLRKD